MSHTRKVVAAVAAIIILIVLAVWMLRKPPHRISETGMGVSEKREAPHRPQDSAHGTKGAEPQPESVLALEWPSTAPFNPGEASRGVSATRLPRQMPDFGRTGGTLGPAGESRFEQWRLATVIVRSKSGWGSGAIISADGWLLSNYHVVEHAVQEAALGGRHATVAVIAPRLLEGRIQPRDPMNATVYRADPVHDLALLKLDVLPAGEKAMPYFRLAARMRDNEDCFVIGSQANGPGWWVRSGTVSEQFDFPEELSQFAAGVASAGAHVARSRATVVVTDARVSSGDSGGPLLNVDGELIGLTFATPANVSGGSVGWHIALPHLRTFVSDLPSLPEAVPFDVWTAGLPESARLAPELLDGDGDRRSDALRYRYVVEDASRALRPAAVTLFVDFEQRTAATDDQLSRVPRGLWGIDARGRFRFDVLLITRADGLVVAGYTDADGVVNDVRLGRSREPSARLVWRRDRQGQWSAETPAASVPLVDPERVGATNLDRLQVIARQLLAGRAASENALPASGADRRPNRIGDRP